MHSKIDLLNRTLQLATFGLGKVSPEPLVAWVLTSNDDIILAEGWLPNKFVLSPHITRAMTQGCTLYVNALPSFWNELLQIISEYHIIKICCAGSVNEAFKKQITQNITWEDQLLLDEELYVNRRYYHFSQLHRPYIILKWAQTEDGYIARENYDSKWISSTQSRRLVHKWRTEEDAIMVATNTAHYDNPKLNVRNWSGRNPTRVVMDKTLRLDRQLYLFDGSQPTLCYNLHLDQSQNNLALIRIPQTDGKLGFFKLVLEDLYQRNVQSLIVEGGAQLLHFLIENQLWDEARVFTSKQIFGKGIAAPALDQQFLSNTLAINQDLLNIYQRLEAEQKIKK